MHIPHTKLVFVGRLKVHREHIKNLLAYGGAFLMLLDFVWALPITGQLLHHYAEVYEHVIACCGKGGAAAAGFAIYFDRIVKVASAA